MRLEGLPFGTNVAENFKTLLIPFISPCQDGRKDDNEEAVGEVGHGWVSWLQAALELAKNHDDSKGTERDGTGQAICEFPILDEEDDLVKGAAVGGTGVLDDLGKTHLGNELIDKNDDTDGADKTSQEGAAQNAVQEAEPEEASHQNNCS